jgi:hypothetical protein
VVASSDATHDRCDDAGYGRCCARLKFGLIPGRGSLEVPVMGGRVVLSLSNGNDLFTGYVVHSPTYQYLGRGDSGALYRYDVDAVSDVMLDGSESASSASSVCES